MVLAIAMGAQISIANELIEGYFSERPPWMEVLARFVTLSQEISEEKRFNLLKFCKFV